MLEKDKRTERAVWASWKGIPALAVAKLGSELLQAAISQNRRKNIFVAQKPGVEED